MKKTVTDELRAEYRREDLGRGIRQPDIVRVDAFPMKRRLVIACTRLGRKGKGGPPLSSQKPDTVLSGHSRGFPPGKGLRAVVTAFCGSLVTTVYPGSENIDQQRNGVLARPIRKREERRFSYEKEIQAYREAPLGSSPTRSKSSERNTQ